MTENRCTGHCCRLIIVPVIHARGGLDEFKKLAAEHGAPEYMQVADMLIPTGATTTIDPLTLAECPEQMTYRCRNFDEATGDCKVYDRRPRMCSEYPYGGSCMVPGCTYKLAQEVDHVTPNE